MRPVKTHTTNFTLIHPNHEVGSDLDCSRHDDEELGVYISSSWCMDQSERAMVAAGALVEFTAHAPTHPPVAFRVTAPSCLPCGVYMKLRSTGEGDQRRDIFRCPQCGATKS